MLPPVHIVFLISCCLTQYGVDCNESKPNARGPSRDLPLEQPRGMYPGMQNHLPQRSFQHHESHTNMDHVHHENIPTSPEGPNVPPHQNHGDSMSNNGQRGYPSQDSYPFRPNPQMMQPPPGIHHASMPPPRMPPTGMYAHGFHPSGMGPFGMHPLGMHLPGMGPPGMHATGMQGVHPPGMQGMHPPGILGMHSHGIHPSGMSLSGMHHPSISGGMQHDYPPNHMQQDSMHHKTQQHLEVGVGSQHSQTGMSQEQIDMPQHHGRQETQPTNKQH